LFSNATDIAKKNFVSSNGCEEKEGKARKTEVYTGNLNGMKMYTVGIDESFKKRTAQTSETNA